MSHSASPGRSRSTRRLCSRSSLLFQYTVPKLSRNSAPYWRTSVSRDGWPASSSNVGTRNSLSMTPTLFTTVLICGLDFSRSTCPGGAAASAGARRGGGARAVGRACLADERLMRELLRAQVHVRHVADGLEAAGHIDALRQQLLRRRRRRRGTRPCAGAALARRYACCTSKRRERAPAHPQNMLRRQVLVRQRQRHRHRLPPARAHKLSQVLAQAVKLCRAPRQASGARRSARAGPLRAYVVAAAPAARRAAAAAVARLGRSRPGAA